MTWHCHGMARYDTTGHEIHMIWLVLQDLAIQCVVPRAGAVQLEHAVWIENISTCNEFVHYEVYSILRNEALIDRSISQDLLFTEGLFRLFSGSRAEQLAMDAGSGFNEPDLDLMLVLKNIAAPRSFSQTRMSIEDHSTDPAFCKVVVDGKKLNAAIHPFLLQRDGKDFLDAERFREKSVEISEQNQRKHSKWDTIETHGPACKVTVTGYGDLDIIMSISCAVPFYEMIDFYSRVGVSRNSYWRNVVPRERLCEIDGVLVPICPRESEGMERQLTFRKSFSAQEFILVSSLPHWCRQAAVVFKHTVLRKLKISTKSQEGTPKICSYHLKTIFLWAGELMSQEMWDMGSPARLLDELLYRLIRALGDRKLENYWIPASNLLRYHSTEYLAECCRAVKGVRSNIIACVLDAPENPLESFGAKNPDDVKDMFFRANNDVCSAEDFLKSLRDTTRASTWQLMAKLLRESSGSPQCLQQVGDMALGLESLLGRIHFEDDGKNHGFAMASYIVEKLLLQSERYDGG